MYKLATFLSINVFAFVSLGKLHVLNVESDIEKLSMNTFIQYKIIFLKKIGELAQ